ncbi:MAG: PKD domain-containing protein, partial [Firmicutes bacterium]|nr:PKD domain-containing protein [Bacillota bacterium]
DAKWVLVTVRAVYLTIQPSAGGTTAPAPGTYAYARGSQVQVAASPSSGYVLDCWLLDGQNSGAANPFTVIMNTNHTLKPAFTASLSASLNSNVTSGAAPLPVLFTGTVSGGSPPYTYYWNFGDGAVNDTVPPTSLTTMQAAHTYAQPGPFTCALTVADSAGRKGYAYKQIAVTAPFDFSLSKSNDIAVQPGKSGTSTI